jgi:lactose/L-arabinose transport system ATP-binding protein
MNVMQANVVAAEGGAAILELVNQGGARLTKPMSGPLPAVGSRVTVGVRPEHFLEGGRGDCDVRLAIDVAENLGSTSFYYANIAGGEELVVQRDTARAGPAGDIMTVSIPSGRAYLFDPAGNRLR